jgi:hypothetical protein
VPERAEERGSFEQISLSLLLIRALDQRWSGTLTLTAPGREKTTLEFQRGLACRALVDDNHVRLGELLVGAGVLTEPELGTALEKDEVLGAALMAGGLIDEKMLQRALVLQLLKRMVRAFSLPPQATWWFAADHEAFADMPDGLRIDTLRVLWAGLSSHGEMGGWLNATIKRIGESPFQVRSDVNLRRFGFTGDARRVVRAVRDERATIPELVSRALAPEDVVRQIVYLLAITRYLDFAPVGGDSLPPSGTTSSDEPSMTDESSISDETTTDDPSVVSEPPTSSDEPPTAAPQPRRVARIKLRRVAVRPAAPDPPGSGEPRGAISPRGADETLTPMASTSPASPPLPLSRPSDTVISERKDTGIDTLPDSSAKEHLRAEINSRLARLERETPLSLLNVTPAHLRGKSEAQVTDILWAAYERCSRRWHPDNCPGELSDLREGMAKIYDSMTDAFMSLTEPSRRTENIAKLLQTRNSDFPPTIRSDTGLAPPGAPPEAPPDAADAPTDPADLEQPRSGERVVDLSLAATELHARALVALSEQRLAEALSLCRDACDVAPGNPDFLASSVWIRASMPQPDTKLLLLDLDALLRDHPDHVQGRYYRGVLRRRLGSDNSARRDFERVLELQPGHAGAEVQLAALRRASQI